MIISKSPELVLQEHQKDAYREVIKAHKTGNRASVVMPTGCGKSFVALQLIKDNRDKKILFLAPTEAIKNQMYRYIAKYIVGEVPSKGRSAKKIVEEYFPNLTVMLYPSLVRAKPEVLDKLNPDIIIMDELHRTAADKWGEKIDYLLKRNPNAKVLGLTATPDRADDKDVIDRLFEGNISYELTLVEALRKRIIKSPQYVKCDYAFGEELEDIKEYIDTCNNPEKKKEVEEKYKKMRAIVDRAEGIPELFEHNITKKDGKYIVFCKDKEHLDEIMPKMKEWLAKVDAEPEMYSVYSGYGSNANKKTIEQFENSKTKHIKLLFSVDMLNEGLHVEDISGVVMLRPTESRIIYLQQLGRALSSDSSREPAIIFDLVNNYLKNNLDRELNPQINSKKGGQINRREEFNGTNYLSSDEDIDIFRVQGETQDFLELLEETKGLIGPTSQLESAKKIKEWAKSNGKLPSVGAQDEAEKKLGQTLVYIRQWLKGEKEGYEEVEKIIEELDAKYRLRLVQAKKIKEWAEINGKLPSNGAENEEEKNLAGILNHVRQWLKQEKEGYEEVGKIIGELDAKYRLQLIQARKIKEWAETNGRLPWNGAQDKEGKQLAGILSNIKQWLKEEKEGHEEVGKIIKELETKYDLQLVQVRKIKEWAETNGRLPVRRAKNEEEKILADTLRRIRQWLKGEKEGSKEVGKIIEELDAKYNERKIQYGDELIQLVQVRKIKEWAETNGRLPLQGAKDEEEKKLGRTLRDIKQWLKQEREGSKEVGKIIEELNAKYNERKIKYGNEITQLVQAREIKDWAEANGKLPSQGAKDEEEKKLGRTLNSIKQWLKKEKEGSEEVRKIIEELDAKYKKGKQITAQEIGKSGLSAPVTDCDEVERAIRTMQQTKEVTH